MEILCLPSSSFHLSLHDNISLFLPEEHMLLNNFYNIAMHGQPYLQIGLHRSVHCQYIYFFITIFFNDVGKG